MNSTSQDFMRLFAPSLQEHSNFTIRNLYLKFLSMGKQLSSFIKKKVSDLIYIYVVNWQAICTKKWYFFRFQLNSPLKMKPLGST